MATGAVKWFDLKKGYGFIKPDDSSSDIFVHISALTASNIKDLKDGQKVSYDSESKNGKVSAINIKLIA